MDVDILSLWGSVASATDLDDLISSWRSFTEQVTDDTLKDEAPLIAETVLVGRPQGIVDVLEASFRADVKRGGDARSKLLDFLQQLLRTLGEERLAPGAPAAAAARAAEKCAQFGWHEVAAKARVSALGVASLLLEWQLGGKLPPGCPPFVPDPLAKAQESR
ncbi:hypothetical protein MNEG_11374 [Monoraphidium neglectum]|uniref:Uncharacterized protein n=1 Tax=Monoraphidium neglectum TaxID=145388 RepID=A0A0D2M5S9_9CHLO|nr:hypothetical protein MNEG_11374 [Monoraphidium neglectum]KIY96586.1 hypothetical protein MNEG_11374 [Monoraphidium neglectum]|eukprot:XP_013895606.1 hypothetical protein MNEG_11374 [Monoraphidium neglectum]